MESDITKENLEKPARSINEIGVQSGKSSCHSALVDSSHAETKAWRRRYFTSTREVGNLEFYVKKIT